MSRGKKAGITAIFGLGVLYVTPNLFLFLPFCAKICSQLYRFLHRPFSLYRWIYESQHRGRLCL